MKFDLVDNFIIPRSARSVIFVGRQTDGRAKHFFHVSDQLPYFGVPYHEKDVHKGNKKVISITDDYTIEGKLISRITVYSQSNISELKSAYSQTYESNIPFNERVKINIGLRSGFEIPDTLITGSCFTCKNQANKYGVGYHKIKTGDMITW